jgi:flavin-dependent dehydrogenase
MRNPVRILGAGVAGLTAAITLVRNGYPVVVFEREYDVGMRFHNDIQGLENGTEQIDVLDELKNYSIDIDFDVSPLYELTITNCQKQHDIRFNRPLHYMIKRGPFPGTLDYSLKNQALSSGVDIVFNSTEKAENVEIITTGPLHAKTNAVAKGLVFKTDIKKLAVGIYNDQLAYKGYSYLLISNGHGCMASVVYNDFSKANECFEKTRTYFMSKYDLKILESRPMAGIGCFSTNPQFRKEKQIYAGEAAGLQDFVAGFGMRYAFQSGYLAAQSIIKEENYEVSARKKFIPMVKSCIVNRWLWETILKIDNYSFMLLIYKLMANSNNKDSFHYNYWQKVFFPIAIRYIKKTYPDI